MSSRAASALLVLLLSCGASGSAVTPELALDSYCRHIVRGVPSLGEAGAAAQGVEETLTADAAIFERLGDETMAEKIRVLVAKLPAAVEQDARSASVYVRDGASRTDLDAIRSRLSGLAGVVSIRFESKDEAYRRFVEIFKNHPEVIVIVSANALPASFGVTLKTSGDFAALEQAMSGLPGIDRIVQGNREESSVALLLTPSIKTCSEITPESG